MVNKVITYTPVFEVNKQAYEAGIYRAIVNQGSSRSSKTYSVIQLLIIICLSEKKQVSIVSPSLPHLKRGARRDFLTIMEEWGLFKENSFNRTDNVYEFDTGAYIEFFGADDSGKVRGPGRDILFVNEANLISEPIYTQLAIRTTETIFLDFNPADEHSYVYTIADSPGNKFIHSTYKNNLQFLTPAQVQEIENLQYVDQNLWKVFGLGLRGSSIATVYTHWNAVDGLPLNEKGEALAHEIIYGLDFGFNVPTAMVKVMLLAEGDVYVEELIYKPGLTNSDLIEILRTLNLGYKTIYADAAEPQRIEEIYRQGFNIKPANKSVKDGIDKLRASKLNIFKTSDNLLREIKSYKYQQDKNDKILEDPVKVNDHLMDAMRYAVHTHLLNPAGEYDIR